MKKIIALAAVAILSFSCNDDDGTALTDESFDGTWTLTSFELNEAIDLNDDGTASTDIIAESSCFNNSTITFDSETNAILNFEELDIDIQVVNGTDNEFEYSVQSLGATSEIATYTVDGNTATVTFDYGEGITETLDFTLSDNTLTVVVPEILDLPILDDDDVVDSFVGGTLVFTMQ